MAEGIKILAQNKKAWHEYFIEERFEAGIVLMGTEVKSLRMGKANLSDSYVKIQNGEMWLLGTHISPYKEGNIFNHEPVRKRKLLMHKSQILKLTTKVDEKGFSLIPVKMYLSKGKIKIEIALAKGKKLYDKRDSITTKQFKKDKANMGLKIKKKKKKGTVNADNKLFNFFTAPFLDDNLELSVVFFYLSLLVFKHFVKFF